MEVIMDSTTPIYIQIAEALEDLILEDKLKEDEQAPSTNQLADHYKLNPATARKGLNILVDKQILFKKRGLGMFVSEGAKELIITKRKEDFADHFITKLLSECKKLNITVDEVIDLIKTREGSVYDETTYRD
ncbi:MAG: GntR family transcriptional regulator [Vallitaleaceae bacterium]|jgi:GntR family transcriptional regulator|nr:GntR family transcriptional regulator [Vallitaleaceae bacterium]